MATQNIEFSKEGIKFSYNRFLADSAAGFVIILIAIITYYNADIAIQLRQNLQTSISKEVEIFLCLLLFLLSTPLGLTINALSWAVLGWFQAQIKIKWCDNESFLIKSTKNELQFKDCKEFFGLSKDNWDYISAYSESVISVHRVNLIESLEFLGGLCIFIRNLSLLSFILPVIYLVLCFACNPEHLKDFFVLFAITYPLFIIFALFMLALSSFVSFYHDLSVLSKMYISCKKKEYPSEIKGDIEKIVNFFISLNTDVAQKIKLLI